MLSVGKRRRGVYFSITMCFILSLLHDCGYLFVTVFFLLTVDTGVSFFGVLKGYHTASTGKMGDLARR